jgi:hypothetical protein
MFGAGEVVFVHHHAVVLAQQFFAAVAEQAFDAVVDEGEAAFDVQGVDEVGRAVDQEAMPLFRTAAGAAGCGCFPFEATARQRVVDAAHQFVGLVGLAHIVDRAGPQRADRSVDRRLARDYDHRRIDAAIGNEAQHFVAVEIGHAQIEQDDVELLLADRDQRVATAERRRDVVSVRRQQARQTVEYQGLVVYHEHA